MKGKIIAHPMGSSGSSQCLYPVLVHVQELLLDWAQPPFLPLSLATETPGKIEVSQQPGSAWGALREPYTRGPGTGWGQS